MKTCEKQIDKNVTVSSIDIRDDYCEECQADTANSNWWADQDGIYVDCDECGHNTFFSNGLFDEETYE